MKFAVPRIWLEPTNHSSNCYFCLVDPSTHQAGKNAPAIVYPDIPSLIVSVPHSAQLPIPNSSPQEREQISEDDSIILKNEEDTSDCEDYITGDELDEKKPYFFKQQDINDLIRELCLTKCNAELLTSRLKQWNLLDSSVRVAEQRNRHQDFSSFFATENKLCFCHNVNRLFGSIGISCVLNDWRLFIDSSSKNLKAVLLHNRNRYPSGPLSVY